MRRILAAALAGAALLIAAPATSAAPPNSLNVVEAVVTVGESVTVEWTARSNLDNVWALLSCQAEGGGGLGAWEELDDPEPDTIATGITPSWDGTTPASCTVSLFTKHNGANHSLNASDTFSILPLP